MAIILTQDDFIDNWLTKPPNEGASSSQDDNIEKLKKRLLPNTDLDINHAFKPV
jgi:hypothetical protein